MKELIGKTIQGIQVSQDEGMLRFICGDSEVTYSAVGDCCSESWFADLVGYQALIDHTVRDVQEIALEESKPAPEDAPTSSTLTSSGRTRQDCDEIYGYVITTDGGRCTIAFRNSSNGYYGGWLEATDPGTLRVRQYRGWREITDDWSA